MSVLDRLRSVRTVLATGVFMRGLAWGGATAASLVLGASIADLLVPLSLTTRNLLLVIAVLSAAIVAVTMWRRDRAVLSLGRVALWVEECFPSLEYTLVTAIETGDHSIVDANASPPWTAAARRRALRVLGVPVAAFAAAVVVILLLPGGAVARMRSPHAGDSLDRRGLLNREGASRLSPLVADVVPPAYSGERASSIDEPSDIRTLTGSTITLRGRGDATGVVATIGADSISATARGDRWSITLPVSNKAAAVRLADRTYKRIIAVEPITDLPPLVTLHTPPHDSVLRTPTGRIPLSADATDDYGITTSSFEYIVSSGEGETFTFKSGVLGAVQPKGKHASLSAMLSIESLGLKPGDIVHVRAVARDANTVSGPGLGVSETRSIRIARADEYDSVAVEAAAPSEEEKSVISERMLILLTEALEKKRPKLARPALVAESHTIAVDQRRLRRTVGEIVFTRLGGDPTGEEHNDDEAPARAKSMAELLARADSATNRSTDAIDFEGGESPVVATNKPLLEAYNAMWDATTQLEIGEPAKALPHMRRALAAIQKARQAERLYLRGNPPAVVIDVSNARLKGKDKGSSSERRALTSADSAEQARIDRFTRAVALSATNAAAAIDSLLILRIDALGEAPAFAAALSDAVAAMRGSKSDAAAIALQRARRTLAGAPVARDSLSRWGMVP